MRSDLSPAYVVGLVGRIAPTSVRRDQARRRDEAGFVGGFEGLVFGLLIFVVGTVLVANAWGVVDTKLAVVAAAREAARTYVEAPDAVSAQSEAVQAASDSLAGYGRAASRATVAISGRAFGRCARISVEVSYPAPVVQLPFIGSVGQAEAVSAVHSELVDPYRSGLTGTALCA
ncbi:MAG: hypothetical protein ACRDYC_12915 [Acidimicrobiales bacterium]